jgi:DNA-binding NarL/FixJ family response regulator
LDHPIPKDADAQLLKAALDVAVVCQLETQLERPDPRDLKKIDAVLTDIRTRLGEPEPEPKPIEPGLKATLDELEKNWTAKPHKQHGRGRGR